MEKEIGQNIKILRHIVNLSQKEFASELGLSQQQLSKYERGQSKPSITVLYTLADKYEVSLDWLCGLNNLQEEYKLKQ